VLGLKRTSSTVSVFLSLYRRSNFSLLGKCVTNTNLRLYFCALSEPLANSFTCVRANSTDFLRFFSDQVMNPWCWIRLCCFFTAQLDFGNTQFAWWYLLEVTYWKPLGLTECQAGNLSIFFLFLKISIQWQRMEPGWTGVVGHGMSLY